MSYLFLIFAASVTFTALIAVFVVNHMAGINYKVARALDWQGPGFHLLRICEFGAVVIPVGKILSIVLKKCITSGHFNKVRDGIAKLLGVPLDSLDFKK